MADGDLFGWSGDEGLEPGCAYFFALRPRGAVAHEIGQRRESVIRTLHVQRPSRVTDDRLHLSLCAPRSLRRLRAPFEESLRRAGDEVAACGFRLRLDGLDQFQGAFDSPCVVLRSDEETGVSVQALKDSITIALFKHGFGRDTAAIAPHVTMFYADGVSPLADRSCATIHWQVDEFVLIRSWVGRHKHEMLHCWPLG